MLGSNLLQHVYYKVDDRYVSTGGHKLSNRGPDLRFEPMDTEQVRQVPFNPFKISSYLGINIPRMNDKSLEDGHFRTYGIVGGQRDVQIKLFHYTNSKYTRNNKLITSDDYNGFLDVDMYMRRVASIIEETGDPRSILLEHFNINSNYLDGLVEDIENALKLREPSMTLDYAITHPFYIEKDVTSIPFNSYTHRKIYETLLNEYELELKNGKKISNMLSIPISRTPRFYTEIRDLRIYRHVVYKKHTLVIKFGADTGLIAIYN
jgi:hypothetical protein